MGEGRLLTVQEIAKHNTSSDCWLVINGQVWDLTDFLEQHPGGSASEYCTMDSDQSCSY